MNYNEFSAVDFAMDDFFQEWVKNPTPELDAFWKNWIHENLDKQQIILEAKQILKGLDATNLVYNQEFINDIWNNVDRNTNENQFKKSLILRKYIYKIAAGLTILVVSTALIWSILQNKNELKYTTGFGEISSFVLPDSSVITLNANSSIKYKMNEDITAREVWLEGEAFFKVRKNQAAEKFIVHTSKFDIEVLGTEFNVNNRRKASSVVLNSGVIKLNNAENPAINNKILKPGDLIQSSGKTGKVINKVVDPNLYKSWVNGMLVFNKTPVAEIADKLEDLYGFKIEIVDKQVGQMTFTASIQIEENSPDLIFSLLEESFNLEIRRNENKIKISNKK